MRPNCCLTILCVSIFVLLDLTQDANGEDSDCELDLISPHNTVYEAFLGEDLRINCTVVFCSDSPPLVSWSKREASDVPVDVSSSSHIKTEWKLSKHLIGISFLIFQKVRINDSGVYHCQSETIVSHNIKVNVSVHGELTTVPWMTSKPVTDHIFWLSVSRVVGLTMFAVILATLCIASGCRCNGKSRDAPSRQSFHDALPTTHIYDNDQ